jgi:uncharacterized protein YceH (UPF0502 family)
MPDSQLSLSAPAVRVLGSLLEKETTTPEYYPLSLLALTNACNQRTSRNPVMDLSEDEVRTALNELEDVGLAAPVRGNESRVTKYAHHIGEVFNLRRGELAVLCVLLLRGPQTPGELRSRTERIHAFAGMDEIETTVQQLVRREPPLARPLPREPGTREVRYAHLLSPLDELAVPTTIQSSESGNEPSHRIAALEAEVAELRSRLSSLEEKFAQLTGG